MQEGLLDQKPRDADEKPEFVKNAQSTAQWTIELLRPSVLTRPGMRKQIRGTAYLDGLRGFAAFLVYWHHHQLWPRQLANGLFENAYGWSDRHHFCSMPFVRTFFTGGHFAVSVFFVISGYVLSAKPLALINAGEHARLGDSLASALFRRWLRLHIPVILVSFFYITSWHLFGIYTVSPKQEVYYVSEVYQWYLEFKNFSFIFRGGDSNTWLKSQPHAWSIPVEFRGSIIIYTAILALSRCRRNARLWGEAGLTFYFMYIVDGWYGAMFMSGMLLCDLQILAKANNLPVFIAKCLPYKTSISYAALFIALYLSGVPSADRDVKLLQEAYGWQTLAWFKPQAVFDTKWFYLFWAAVCMVACIPQIHWLRAFFETPFNQYLGRISFALYLVHGPILWTLGDRIYAATGWYRDEHLEFLPSWVNIFPLSQKGPLGLEPSFLLPHFILLPLTLWVAEVVTKLFDEPSVRFSQWAYQYVLPAED